MHDHVTLEAALPCKKYLEPVVYLPLNVFPAKTLQDGIGRRATDAEQEVTGGKQADVYSPAIRCDSRATGEIRPQCAPHAPPFRMLGLRTVYQRYSNHAFQKAYEGCRRWGRTRRERQRELGGADLQICRRWWSTA